MDDNTTLANHVSNARLIMDLSISEREHRGSLPLIIKTSYRATLMSLANTRLHRRGGRAQREVTYSRDNLLIHAQ